MPSARARTLSTLTVCALLLAAAASAANLKVLCAGAVRPLLLDLAGELRSHGDTLQIDSDTGGALAQRIQHGEAFDVALLPSAALDALAAARKVEQVHPLVSIGIGVAVRADATPAPLQTVDEFKSLLRTAGRVAYIDPAAGGSSGIYMQKLFEQLGMAAAIRDKALLVPGGLTAERIVHGDADVAIQQLSELMAVPGVRVLGPLPEAVQNYTTYAVAVAPGTHESAAVARLVQALTSTHARALLPTHGMQQPAP